MSFNRKNNGENCQLIENEAVSIQQYYFDSQMWESDQKPKIELSFPMAVGPHFTVSKLTWADFKGRPNTLMPWSAHIYWGIEYTFKKRKGKKKPEVMANVIVLPTSWVKRENISTPLLQHETGHYLIGCICALEFLKRVDSNRIPLSYNFAEYVRMVFNSTLREYIKLQKRYDEETEHRLNFDKQDQWMQRIYSRILEYKNEYEAKRIKKMNQPSINIRRPLVKTNSLKNK